MRRAVTSGAHRVVRTSFSQRIMPSDLHTVCLRTTPRRVRKAPPTPPPSRRKRRRGGNKWLHAIYPSTTFREGTNTRRTRASWRGLRRLTRLLVINHNTINSNNNNRHVLIVTMMADRCIQSTIHVISSWPPPPRRRFMRFWNAPTTSCTDYVYPTPIYLSLFRTS